jgi:serine protease
MFKYTLVMPFLCLAVISGCGGSGGDTATKTDSGSTPKSTTYYTVSVQLQGSGSATPIEQQVAEGESGFITLSASPGYKLHNATGCSGTLSGGEFTTGAIVADCHIDVTFKPAGAVSGQLFPASDTLVDGTLNDRQASFSDNGSCESAQMLDSSRSVYGFSSAVGTGGDLDSEYFALSGNHRDFYRLQLNAGHVVELEVADASDNANLNLFLWNSDCSVVSGSSTDGGDIEQVVALSGGEFVVEVRAVAGISKYVLRTATMWNADYSAEELETLSAGLPAFVANEIILEFSPSADEGVHDAINDALGRSEGIQLSFRHRDTSRATLAQVQPIGAAGPQLSTVMEDLQSLSPRAYETLDTLRTIQRLSQQPGIQRAEPNFLLSAEAEPNDPGYGEQWHFEAVQLSAAWHTTTGVRADGEDIVVAVLDTGVYLGHEDLRAKMMAGYDFQEGDADPDDYNTDGGSSWHGTHVAGTIAASTDNSTGVAGVSWAAKILPVRVIGDAGGTSYNVIQGVRFAAGLSNDSGTLPSQTADVINLSLGGGGYSSIEQNLYSEVSANGIFVVAAAGNENSEEPRYPASYDKVLSVSATSCDNSLASYSSYGPTVSIAAPGGDSRNCGIFSSGRILSTVGTGSGATRSAAYGAMMGTSMAAPHVSGIIGLMLARYPELTFTQFSHLLTNGDITEDLGAEGRDDQFGYGLINAEKAVQAAQALSDGSVQWSAQVVADPGSLYFGQGSEVLFSLQQEGEGNAPGVVDWRSSASWLSAIEQNVDEKGLGTYKAQVDRSQFAEEDAGRYQAELIFALESGGDLRLVATVQVGFATEAAPIYVLLLESSTLEAVYETRAEWNESGELRYAFSGIEPGEYVIRAGSDTDVDKLICQRGEMCGGYPEVEQEGIISVTGEDPAIADVLLDLLSQSRPFPSDSIQPVSRQ